MLKLHPPLSDVHNNNSRHIILIQTNAYLLEYIIVFFIFRTPINYNVCIELRSYSPRHLLS